MRQTRKLQFSLTIVIIVGIGLALATVFYSREKSESAASAAAVIATHKKDVPNPFEGIKVSAQSAIVVDLSTGHTLYSQNPDTQLPLASLTKLISLYEATSVLSPDSIVTISSTSLAQDGNYGFTEGESYAFKDLSRFALVASSNDAAEAITEATAQSESMSIDEMLSKAITDAGLSKTYAHNGTGLDIDLQVSGAYGTARDMAKLAGEFLSKSPELAAATTLPYVTIRSTTGIVHRLPNTNPDTPEVPGMRMSKTGYTDLAGGNLVIIFDAGIDHPVAIVVLGSTIDARFTDVERLMHATLAQFAGLPRAGTTSN